LSTTRVNIYIYIYIDERSKYGTFVGIHSKPNTSYVAKDREDYNDNKRKPFHSVTVHLRTHFVRKNAQLIRVFYILLRVHNAIIVCTVTLTDRRLFNDA
jgi:hypothetical protein